MERARIDRSAELERALCDPEVIRRTAKLLAAAAREDFAEFRHHMDQRLLSSWWQYDAGLHLQEFWRDFKAGKKPVLILQAPPQHGKTRIIEDFVGWVAGQDPDLKIIFASFSEDLGTRVNLDLQRMIESPAYQFCFKNTQLSNEANVGIGKYLKNTEYLEFVAHRGSFRNTTVLGQINGQGLDIGVVDDPIKGRREASSKTVRDMTWNWLTDDFFLRFSEHAGMLMICTRWHLDDPVGRWLDAFPDVKVLKYAAIAEDDDWTVAAGYRRPGEALFPEFKSLEFLLQRKSVLTQPGWSSLYQQEPIAISGNMFPVEQVLILPTAPDRKDIQRSVRYWDKAGTAGAGAFTAGVLMHQLGDGRFFVEDVRHGQWPALEREKVIEQMAQIDRSQLRQRYEIWVEQEPGSGGKESAESTIRRLAGFNVYADKVTGAKEIRAEPYSAQFQAGNVLIKAASWNVQWLEEHELFPMGRRKDIVDASAGAFNKLCQPASRYDSTWSWVTGDD